MKDETIDNPFEESEEPDTDDIASLLRAMQQQLHHLEKKVDLLIGRSQERSGDRPPHARSFGRRPPARPFRSPDHSHHHGKREREPGQRDRDSSPGHFYERRPQEKGRRPSSGKKPSAFKRKDWD